MSERIVAVVPVRSLRHGKTRLSSVLGDEARAALLRRIADRVVTAVVDSGLMETVLVVSSDAETLEWAGQFGPVVVAAAQPEHRPGLNGAIDAGREWALGRSASAVVSLFADLPLIVPDDIRGLVARNEPVVLGADRRGQGTNAFLLRLAGRGSEFTFAFGNGSLVRHLREARRLGLNAALHDAPGIAFDLDTPDDWSDFIHATADCMCADGLPSVACAASVG
ncbi:MAG TPA: 2-phospho-L-lactate guanylyltransferase [Thermomicrobiales bacterium]|nr:2-phospho-L-lactate guanylyltransferase [Thermomicrobiales bacterium]